MEAKLKSGVTGNLGSLFDLKDLKVMVDDNDQVAIHTGIVMADLVLTLNVRSGLYLKAPWKNEKQTQETQAG